jgi:hypothetical protein
VSTEGDVVHGLRAAAKLTGWSPSGLQKMVDVGRVRAERVGRSYTFRAVDLQAIQRAPGLRQPDVLAPASPAIVPSSTPRADVPEPAAGHRETVAITHSGAVDNTQDNGAVAALAFSDFRAGRSIIDVVIDRRLPPEVVRRFHGEWLGLSNVDDTETPTALERLIRVEEELALRASQLDVQVLAERLAAIESAIHDASAEVERGRRHFETRLGGLEARGRAAGGGSVISDVHQRLTVLEALVRTLPMALVPAPHRCPRCGIGQLATPAACGECGFGLGPAV